jgi:hypothetical protein
MRDAGSRYIVSSSPCIGVGIMGNSIWALGFAIVDARRRKLMKRIGHRDAAPRLSAVVPALPDADALVEVGDIALACWRFRCRARLRARVASLSVLMLWRSAP